MEIFDEYDVVVMGEVASGCAAAITSAKAGANTTPLSKLLSTQGGF